MRSSFARQSIARAEWGIQHVMGEFMTADIGTKPLASPRLQFLKELLKIKPVKTPEVEETKKEEGEKSQKDEGRIQAKKKKEIETMKITVAALQLFTLAAAMNTVEGKEEDGESSEEGNLNLIIAMYTIVVVLFTLSLQGLWKAGVRWYSTGSREETSIGKAPFELEDSEEEKEKQRAPTAPEVGDKGWMTHLSPKKAAESEQKTKDTTNEEEPSASTSRQEDMRNAIHQRDREEENQQNQKKGRRQRGLPFQVITTQYGKVYHTKETCNYLTSPTLRRIKYAKWCPECQRTAIEEKKIPNNESPVYIASSEKPAHTNRCCSAATGNETQVHRCSMCP